MTANIHRSRHLWFKVLGQYRQRKSPVCDGNIGLTEIARRYCLFLLAAVCLIFRCALFDLKRLILLKQLSFIFNFVELCCLFLQQFLDTLLNRSQGWVPLVGVLGMAIERGFLSIRSSRHLCPDRGFGLLLLVQNISRSAVPDHVFNVVGVSKFKFSGLESIEYFWGRRLVSF